MKRISEVISELERIRSAYGDLRVYVFDEYHSGGADDMEANVCLVEHPRRFDTIQEPHVQLSP